MVRAEIGQTMSTSIATAGDAGMNAMLSNVQLLYSTLRDWPFLRRKWDVACGQGDRYKSFPTQDIRGSTATLNTERPFIVKVLFNTIYQDVAWGIGDEEFDIRNSDLGQQEDPIQRIDYATNIAETAHADEFEIWPLPTTAQTLRFYGQRQPYVLAAETDKADLDDLLLVYSVAAELLYRTSEHEKEADDKAGKAAARLNFLTGAYPNRTEKLILGRNTTRSTPRRLVPMIIVR
jgi:hypothetical protein